MRDDATDIGPFLNVCKSSGYDALLYMGPPALQAVEDVRAALRADGSDRYVKRLLEDDNWRSHMIGVAAALLSRDPSEFLEALWATFDRQSWVAPQLAVALNWIDPDFVPEARRRVLARCPSVDSSWPQLAHNRSGKHMASLLRVLWHEPSQTSWVEAQYGSHDVRALLALDIDESAKIVDAWRVNARARLCQPGSGVELTFGS